MAKGKITFKARDYKVGKPHVSKRELQRNNIIEIKSKRVCLRCNESIPVRYNLASKFCSPKCKHAYHYDKRMGRILDEPNNTPLLVQVKNESTWSDLGELSGMVIHESTERIDLVPIQRERTKYINNDFERYLELRKCKLMWY